MYRQPRKNIHPAYQDFAAFDEPQTKASSWRDQMPIVAAGLMLTVAFGFAGHYIGRNAVASNITNEDVTALVAPASTLATKGSLLPDDVTFSTITANTIRAQTVMANDKGDLSIDEPVAPVSAPVHPKPTLKPAKITKMAMGTIKITPAAVDLQAPDEPVRGATSRLALAPAPTKVEKAFKLDAPQKQKVVVERRLRLAEENCLARAVYFESRSESDMGQLAVAKVILNRVKSPDYPKSICGVVYQGSGSRNSCQFSFACDGLPDDVKSPTAWAHAKGIAQRAINNDPAVSMLGQATNYHADYVKPKWAKTMRKLARIGHHIFYTQG